MALISNTYASRGCSPLIAVLVALSVSCLSVSCLGDNPRLEAGEDSSDTTTGDGDGDTTTGDGDGDTTTGDGDGDTTTGDGDGDNANCDNAALDPGETDVDCGGPCSPCADGLACVEGTDCVSQVCGDSICLAPTCEDLAFNGDETDIDCGGPCKFCEYGPLQTELDDFEGNPATHPQVAMFADTSFALTYNGPMMARARWFDEFGDASGASVTLSEAVTYSGAAPIRMVAGVDMDHPMHAVEPGQDLMSMSTDLFLIQRDPNNPLSRSLVNPANKNVSVGDLSLDGSSVTLAWLQDNQVLVRRWDYEVGNGTWLDITPFAAETEPNNYIARQPVLTRDSAGVVLLGWIRCPIMDDSVCDVALRRFDAGWIDAGPVIVSTNAEYYLNPQVALADDGRAAVVWTRLDLNNISIRARILDEDFAVVGQQWDLQDQLAVASHADVAALTDGSFAFAWSDQIQDRVHLRRFIGPDDPKLPEFGDEAPWAGVTNPDSVSISSVANRVVVVWSGTVDMVSQIQGQVLSF